MPTEGQEAGAETVLDGAAPEVVSLQIPCRCRF